MPQPQSALALTASPATTFNFHGHAIRVIMRDGEPWFVAADVCAALEVLNSRDALLKLDDDEKGVGLADTLGGSQQVAIISESGMYTLVLRCRDAVKPGTVPHRFRKWVTSEVLPAIRKTGSYGNTEAPSIDVRDLLLSGQCDCTMPLSPALNAAIKQQAWALAGEAYDLIQEHLRRRVAYEAASGHGEVYEQTALRVIRRGSLNDALAHQHMLNLRFLKEHAGSLLRMTQKFVDEMREAQHLAPSPATQP